ncbi:transcriptional regulator BetI [Actinomyces viscosus]|uniref:Transcriptional regulator BetI n=2 Tax=Actinomyces viscosus TaxID=1656 RepID=A0A448PMG9_ACTVI|nr:transcriptional regulator BetI [Actinomyces viscosus]
MDPAERRDLILSVASRAFASRPYEEVSLAAIAEEAHASEALVHKYFANKAGIYAQVLRRATDELAKLTRQADDALPPGSSARDRVRTSILTYLDFISERSPGWMTYQILAGHEPGEAAQVRQAAREVAVKTLADVVGGSRGYRDEFALWGYLGFLDDACLRWVRAGCPEDQRHSLIDAALGCLEGALGDWRK